MILLDTNVLSEAMLGAHMDSHVSAFLRAHAGSCATTVVTEMEIAAGLRAMPAGRRRRARLEAARILFGAFPVLTVDRATTAEYARVSDARRRIGRPVSNFDALISALALQHDADVATRSIRDFEHTGVRLHNPWEPVQT